MSRDNKFVKGALILSVAGIITKLISAFYRIPLVHMLDDEVMSYYDRIYPIYSLLVAASVVGIPNTVSKLIAEDIVNEEYHKAQKTFKLSLIFITMIGCLGTGLLYVIFFIMHRFGSWEFGYFYVISGIAIAPIFISIMGAVKGFFQGMGNMVPSAISQVLENTVKVIVGVWLVTIFSKAGFNGYKVVSGVTMGASLGVIVATVFIIIMYKLNVKKIQESVKDSKDCSDINPREFFKIILNLAIPATLVAASYSIMRGIDSFTIPSVLMSMGASKDFIDNMIGQMGNTYSIINVPLTFSVAISASLVPAISSFNAGNNIKELVNKFNQGVKLALIIGLPAATGLFLMANEILALVFSKSLGYEGAIYMRYFGICLIMMILAQTFSSVLQGITKQYLPLISLGIATIVKLVLNIVFLRMHLNGAGVAMASLIFYIIIVVLNYIFISKHIPHIFDYNNLLLKPLVASISMGLVIVGLLKIMTYGRLNTIIIVIVAIIVYFIVIFMLKGITREDLSFIKEDHIIIKTLTKLRLI